MQYLILIGLIVLILVIYSLKDDGIELGKFGELWLMCVITFGTYVLLKSTIYLLYGSDIPTYTIAVESYFVLPGLIFLLYIFEDENFLSRYKNWLFLAAGYHTLHTLLQVTLYLIYGRLPNIAHEGSIMIRFGGGWDTPNAFGFFMILPTLLALSQLNRDTFKYSIYALIFSCLILVTFSFTAIACLIGAVVSYYILSGGYKTLVIICISIAVCILLALYLTNIYEFIKTVVELKSRSIYKHLEYMYDISEVGTYSLLGIVGGNTNSLKYSEVYYLYILKNFGIVGLLTLLGIVAYPVTRIVYLNIMAPAKVQNQVIAHVSFVISILVGSANLPLIGIFPINVYFWLSILILVKLCDRPDFMFRPKSVE